jgi:NAD(P)-dependent dehydrogenase (short-subunit alcohol dehydrogenase family)
MYAKKGIRCNAIAPGGVATNIGSSMKISMNSVQVLILDTMCHI